MFWPFTQKNSKKFSCEIITKKGLPVVKVKGEIDLNTTGSLDRAIEAARHEYPAGVVLNLRSVCFVDSVGVSLFAKWARKLGNKPLVLYNVPSCVRRIISISGLKRRTPNLILSSTEQAALKKVK